MAYSSTYGIHVVEARNRTATYLQDNDYTRWTKHELNTYLQQGAEDFVRRVGFPLVEHAHLTSDLHEITFSPLLGTPNFTTGETITGSVTNTTGEVTGVFGSAVRFKNQKGIGFQIKETVTGGTSGLSGDVATVSTNYEIPLPENMLKISHVEVDGKEVQLITESEIRYLAATGSIVDTETSTQDKVIRIFKSNSTEVPKWRETTGNIEAIILKSASCESFRLYPIPTSEQVVRVYGTYRPLHSSDIVPYQYLNGTVAKRLEIPSSGFTPGTDSRIRDEDGNDFIIDIDSNVLTLIQNDVASSTVYTLRPGEDFRYTFDIDRQYMDILVFGALERAYLKEHDLRNVEKSEYFRNKKEALMQDALRTEALNSASVSGGINFNRLRARSAWQSHSR